jgi:hypothetical protein
MMGERPLGLTVVADLTFLGAVGNLLFSYLLVLLLCVGGAGGAARGPPGPFFLFLIYTPIMLSIVSFIVVWGILKRVRHTGYLSFVLWISSDLYYGFLALWSQNVMLQVATLSLAGLVSTVFIMYFQSEQVRNYWNSRTEQNASHITEKKGSCVRYLNYSLFPPGTGAWGLAATVVRVLSSAWGLLE